MRPTRRRFLTQTLGFSAAVALYGGAGVAPSSAAGKTAAPAAPAGDREAAARHLLAIGDWGVKGKDLRRQKSVSDAMARYAKRHDFRPDGLLLLGDNFYGGLGRRGLESARWKDNVESMYAADVFPCPMYAALGNHDYNDGPGNASVLAQLAYGGPGGQADAPRSRWTLPTKWYRFDVPAGADSPFATVLVLDTNFCYPGRDWVTPAERRRQLRWLEEELSRPRQGRWRIVVGHHPVYSNGKHGDTQVLVDTLDPILRKHRVDLYLSGHDHDLQHLEFARHPTSFVVSGAGGARARDLRSRTRGPFGKAVYGFTHLELRPSRLRVRHIDANGAELHEFSKERKRA